MKNYSRCFVIVLLLICLLVGCKQNPTVSVQSASQSSGEPTVSQIEQLAVAQIYNIVKDCDYWDWDWDGNVKAFKGDKEISFKGESGITNVHFYDGWIYYVKSYDSDSGVFDICRIRSNGEDDSVILNSTEFDNSNTFVEIIFDDIYMYINKGFQLYRYNLQSGETEYVAGDVAIYHIDNNQLYTISHARKDFTIYVNDLETKETKILIGDGVYADNKKPPKLYYSNFIFIDDIMYYTKRNMREDGYYLVELYRYENGESTLIDNTESIKEYSLFEYDGKLCYCKYASDSDIYKLMQYNPQDGKAIELLSCNDFRDKGRISNGYFYYLDSDGNAQQVKIQQD